MLAHLGKELNDGRMNGDLWWFRVQHAGSVHVGKVMFTSMRAAKTSCSGARVRGLNDAMPLTRLTATRLRKKLTDVRKNGDLWWLRPDGKTSRNGHSSVEFA